MDDDVATSAHGRPCVSCRKRKVRCDKTRPCSNCSKAKQLCTYESNEHNSITQSDNRTAIAQTDGDLRERLARLEALMAKMMVRDSASASPSASGDRLEDTDHALTRQSPSQLPPTTPPAIIEHPHAPVGQILFQEGLSAYFDSDFWPGLVSEVPIHSLPRICADS
jgi:hypothetical protein